MKVKVTKLANGKLQLEISDNGNGKVFMKFGDVNQLADLSNLIGDEVERVRKMENHFNDRQQLLKFQ